MAKSRLKSSKASDPKVLIGLSVFFVLIGGMVTDPLAGFVCFVLAGILAFLATLYGTRRLRYIAFLLLIIIVALTVLQFLSARDHLEVYRSKVYKSKTVTGDIK